MNEIRKQYRDYIFQKWTNYSDHEQDLIWTTLKHAKVPDKRVCDVVDYLISSVEKRNAPTANDIKALIYQMPNEEQPQYQHTESYIHVSRADKQANHVIFQMFAKIMGAKTHKIALAAIKDGYGELDKIKYNLPQEERDNLTALYDRIAKLDADGVPRVGQVKSAKQIAQEKFRKKCEMQAGLAHVTNGLD